MNEKPERAIVFTLKIEADSEKELINALNNLTTQFSVGELYESSVSGGYSWSHVYNVKRNNITHDEYFDKVSELLEKEKQV